MQIDLSRVDWWQVVAVVIGVSSAVFASFAWRAAARAANEARRANDRNENLDQRERDNRIKEHLSIVERSNGFVFLYDGEERVTDVKVRDTAGVLLGISEPFELWPHSAESNTFTLYDPSVRPRYLLVTWDGMGWESAKIEFPADLSGWGVLPSKHDRPRDE